MISTKLKKCLCVITTLAMTVACNSNKPEDNQTNIDTYSYELGVVGGFSELINAGVKQLALSAPMPTDKMDVFIIDAQRIASKHDVSLYREPDLIVTDLFSSDIAADQEVLLLFNGTTLESYFSLKAEKSRLEKARMYDDLARLEIARRFGRLLSYSPEKINKMISENSSYRTLVNFGIRASNLFLYYEHLEAASAFYAKTLGMELVADYTTAKIFRMATDAYLILVDAAKGMHTADEPKTVALALLTDQLDRWYAYLKAQNVEFKYEYQPKEGSPHDGFVILDPEGYFLEFEKFNQHPENEKLIPLLNRNKTLTSPTDHENMVPEGLGIHSTITWLYYKDILTMQNFYQNVLGLGLVADQGWAKIYQVTDTGYIGLVDERRGMHSFTQKKAVNVSFIIDQLEPWFDYVHNKKLFELRADHLEIGPENKYHAFVGYDPEGYFMEFDQFYPHKDNAVLMKFLNAE